MWGARGFVNYRPLRHPVHRKVVNSRPLGYTCALLKKPLWGTQRFVNYRPLRHPDHHRVVNSRPRSYTVAL